MPRRPRAFTLIELLVVVAIIALLMAVILPNLIAAREQGRRAKCLGNLKNVATGSVIYAQEDTKNLVVPMHDGIWQNAWAYGGQLWFRCGGPASFGGRTPVTKIIQSDLLFDPNGPWRAETRPLNRYMYSGGINRTDTSGLELFRCPSDRGFPENEKWIRPDYISGAGNTVVRDDVYEKPFFDWLGNSYRFNFCGAYVPPMQGQMTTSTFGARYGKYEKSVSRIVLFSEPLFYLMTVPALNLNPDLAPLLGTHRVLMTDNVVYVDGSSRATKVGLLAQFSQQVLNGMDFGSPLPYDYVLRRGTTWQMDSYPVPAALIRAFQGSTDLTTTATINALMGQPGTPQRRWPGRNFQDNTRRTSGS